MMYMLSWFSMCLKWFTVLLLQTLWKVSLPFWSRRGLCIHAADYLWLWEILMKCNNKWHFYLFWLHKFHFFRWNMNGSSVINNLNLLRSAYSVKITSPFLYLFHFISHPVESATLKSNLLLVKHRLNQTCHQCHPDSLPVLVLSLSYSQTLMSQGQTFPAELKKQQQGPNKSRKRTSLSSSPLPPAPLPPPQDNPSNLFLLSALLGLPEPHYPSGVIQSPTQDAPLALISKPRKDSAWKGKSPQCDSEAGSMPVDLSTGSNRTQGTTQPGPLSQPPTTSPHATGPLAAFKGFSHNDLAKLIADLFHEGEAGIRIYGVRIPGVAIPGVRFLQTFNPTAGLPANVDSDDDLEEKEDEEVAYYAPRAKKRKQNPNVMKRPRPKRPPKVGDPLEPEGPSPREVKHLRKLEAQG